MVKYYGRAKTRTGSVNTKQYGIKMSGSVSSVGHASSVQRYINRRVDSLAGVCGFPKQNESSWRQTLKNKHPYCKQKVSKCLGGAGGVGRPYNSYYKTPDSGVKGCGKGTAPASGEADVAAPLQTPPPSFLFGASGGGEKLNWVGSTTAPLADNKKVKFTSPSTMSGTNRNTWGGSLLAPIIPTSYNQNSGYIDDPGYLEVPRPYWSTSINGASQGSGHRTINLYICFVIYNNAGWWIMTTIDPGNDLAVKAALNAAYTASWNLNTIQQGCCPTWSCCKYGDERGCCNDVQNAIQVRTKARNTLATERARLLKTCWNSALFCNWRGATFTNICVSDYPRIWNNNTPGTWAAFDKVAVEKLLLVSPINGTTDCGNQPWVAMQAALCPAAGGVVTTLTDCTVTNYTIFPFNIAKISVWGKNAANPWQSPTDWPDQISITGAFKDMADVDAVSSPPNLGRYEN